MNSEGIAATRTAIAVLLFAAGASFSGPLSYSPSTGDTTSITAKYDYQSDPSEWPVVYATTGVNGGTFDLNAFLGANRYYAHSTPITGQNATVSNLEAGHIWNGHETLEHVDTFINSDDTFGDGDVEPLYDRHATWVAMLIGGRKTDTDPNIKQSGIAPGADLISAAISTGWIGDAYSPSFGLSEKSHETAFLESYRLADVINTSYGYGDTGGTSETTLFTDGLAYVNPHTIHVAAAGNSGPGSNTVGAPGAGYNTMSVAALGGANDYDSVADFSSRGPQDFSYNEYTRDEDDNLVASPVDTGAVWSAIDIAAPGESITSAFYGGQTGGNNSTLDNSTDLGSYPDAYTDSIRGTSFASPLVAGGAALIVSAARELPELSSNPEARQSVVIRSILMTAADKIDGWDNAQQTVEDGGRTYIETTQSLDWASGAGRMNLDRAFDIQVNGQRDVEGLSIGEIGDVEVKGWDYGFARIGANNDYVIRDPLLGNSEFTATLAWMRLRFYTEEKWVDGAQADLNLSVWELDEEGEFTDLIARSASEFNTAEHLSFTIPSDGNYGIRVEYDGNTFDNLEGQVWGTEGYEQDYAVSWFATAIPEPAMVGIYIFFVFAIISLRRLVRPFRIADGT